MELVPFLPFVVVTTITPAAPREPYWAVSEASLRMVMLSMSPGCKELNIVMSP